MKLTAFPRKLHFLYPQVYWDIVSVQSNNEGMS